MFYPRRKKLLIIKFYAVFLFFFIVNIGHAVNKIPQNNNPSDIDSVNLKISIEQKKISDILEYEKNIYDEIRDVHKYSRSFILLTSSSIVIILLDISLIIIIMKFRSSNKRKIGKIISQNKEFQNSLNDRLVKISQSVDTTHSMLQKLEEEKARDYVISQSPQINTLAAPKTDICNKIGVKVKDKVVEETDIADYFYIKPANNSTTEYELFLQDKIMQSKPHSTHDTNIQKAFELYRIGTNKYFLSETAKVVWDKSSGTGELRTKGRIELK